ncbi:FMN-binding protein [Cellulomonas sp.]|uniref:FMN-binding protein n=1 Tax=Cellulomonas sp. TaxID=40001 RepID=UPI002583E1FB|nr:FMN-binding protein [Cellulomonas sp.]MCR6689078.1 FMN-binding protein [Cellulomonas sp.]
MKRITLWTLSTVSGLVLLLAYPTSTNRAVAGAAPAETSGGTSSAASSGGTSDEPAASDGDDSDDTASDPGASGSDTGSSDTGSSDTGTSTGGTDTGSSGTGSSGTGSSGTAADGTYTGGVAQTRWGPVQVEITVEQGSITSAQAVQYPDDNPRDQAINAYAVPQLNSEVIAAQNAQIDMVSGATVTSEGYLASLQDAIDQAFGA